jgi:Flp pilus assembly pilin Flp
MRRLLKQRLSSFRKLLICTAAATAVEYSLFTSGITLAVIPAVNLMGVNISAVFTTLAEEEDLDVWPEGMTIAIMGAVARLSGEGEINGDMLAANLHDISTIQLFEGNITAGSLSLSIDQIAAITGRPLGAGNVLDVVNIADGEINFSPGAPPPGGSVTHNGNHQYIYRDASNNVVGIINCVSCN